MSRPTGMPAYGRAHVDERRPDREAGRVLGHDGNGVLPPRIGPYIEVGALLAATVLSFLVRTHGPAFPLTLAGTVCLWAAFAIWWVFIFPVNVRVREWTAESVPAGWTRLRARWEYTHAARFVLQLIGLGLLGLSVLMGTR